MTTFAVSLVVPKAILNTFYSLTRVKSVETVLGNTIENIDKFIEEQVLQITPEKFPDVTERVLDDYKVALRSYWKFIKDKQKE